MKNLARKEELGRSMNARKLAEGRHAPQKGLTALDADYFHGMRKEIKRRLQFQSRKRNSILYY